ncbi:hypothetical protein DM01DRAFT_1409743 [Hesseltinella vesiculosa]|uniref:Phosphatidylglycerol/phosphatidylinositol transfer protein n=1 Tax=Hesseltinella vesiculosa TaxID=101127 RepID=A0A1X2GA14_9FUNG|nr:hypothetical protein DM01DRAFT_1409743 [Hesseltinella vesiculosa]
MKGLQVLGRKYPEFEAYGHIVKLGCSFIIPPQLQFQGPGDNAIDVSDDESTKLITNCGNNGDILKIEYIKLNPDPPLRGEKLYINFKGTLKKTVDEGAYALITVKYGVVQLLKKKFDLCKEIKSLDENCPLEEGELTFQKDVDLPKEIPGGKYTVEAEVFTVNDERVTCLHGITTFPRFL